MKNKGKNDYLIHRILNKIEGSSVDWQKEASGNRSLKIQQEDFNRAGKSELLEEARMLEQRGLIQIKWLEYGNDIEKITYCLERAGQFYELSGLTPKWERIQAERQTLCKWSEQAQTGWLKAYYEDQAAFLEKGKQSPDLSKYGEPLFTCLNALEKLRDSDRIFPRILFPAGVRILKTAAVGHSRCRVLSHRRSGLRRHPHFPAHPRTYLPGSPSFADGCGLV